MATPITSPPDQRRTSISGGTAIEPHLEVHDLNNENANCQIDEIIAAGNAVVFSPDTQDQAESEGYDACHWCIGGSTR